MAELYLVEFKGSRKEYFYNSYHHTLKLNEYVIVQAEQGEDLGKLTKLIDKSPQLSGDNRPRSILRPAGADDKRVAKGTSPAKSSTAARSSIS